MNNMENKNHTISFVFCVVIFCTVNFVLSSVHDTSNSWKLSSQDKTHVEDRDVCANIIGSEWKIKMQAKVEDSLCPELLVRVPLTGFTEFVNVNTQTKVVEGGFSIAIFCYTLHMYPYRIHPAFKPFINDKGESKGTYDQLLQQIQGKTCEVVAGDVTVRANRTQYIDFAIPYQSSEVYMIVHASHEWNQTLWTFLKPFTWRLWIVIIGTCLFVGVAVAFLEYRVENPKFKDSPIHHKAVMVVWFPISTFFFQEGEILNRNSKVVLIIWLILIFLIVQIFTATLSAWLTLDQMFPKVPSSFERAGYQSGSYLNDFLTQKYNCSNENLLPLKSIDEYKNALSNGSVNVVFDELPYVELFLAKYPSGYMKHGPINQESGLAFAFSRGTPLLQNFSRAVMEVTESDIMMEMKKKYLTIKIADGSHPDQPLPRSLDVHSFIGLFILTAALTIAAIISSENSIRRANKKILPISTDIF